MIGVFVALDLFLFYIFWEVVLVPMYLIIGIWGGANRIYATIKFVLYTLVGSLLMLVAHPRHRVHATRRRTAARGPGAFDVATLTAFAHDRRVRQHVRVPRVRGLLPRLRDQGPDVPVPHLAARRPRRGADGGLGDPGRRPAQAGRLRLHPVRGAAVPARRRTTWAPAIIVLSLIAIIYGAIVALVQPDLKKLVAYSSVSHMGFVTLGIFVFQEQGLQGAILQMVNHGLITGALFLLVGVIYERTHDRTIAKMGGLVGADAGLRRGVRVLRVRVGRAARAVRVRRRVPDARRVVRVQPGGRGRVATFVMILAAGYLLWMFQRIVRSASCRSSSRASAARPHRPEAGRGADARAARRARRGLRPVPGPPARPRPGHRRPTSSPRVGQAQRRSHLGALAVGGPRDDRARPRHDRAVRRRHPASRPRS